MTVEVSERRIPPRRRRRQTFEQRLNATREIVGYFEEDEVRVRATKDFLLPAADEIAAAVYEHLLWHPETALHFASPDGGLSTGHIRERIDTLKVWLRRAIEAPLDAQNAAYLAEIGRAHTKRGDGDRAAVKARYLLMTMSFVQTALVRLLDGAIADRAELLSTIAAWNKLLMIHLDVFLAVYAAAEGTPHWY